MPVIGMSSLFREMAALGLFRTDLFSFRLAPVRQSHSLQPAHNPPLVFFLLLLSLCLQYGTCINNSWPVIRASSIGDLLMEGRCSPSVPGGMLRVVVSAPICQNAIRQTMEALISTSRPIIFKWLLAEECNQSITDKILLKASLPLCLSLYPSLTPPSFFLTFCLSVFLLLSPFWSNWDTVTTIKERKIKKIKKTNSHGGSSSSHYQ